MSRGQYHAELIVVSGPLAGIRHSLESDDFEIGSASSANLQLPDDGVGLRHCSIRRADHAWRISELSPGRAVFVNGLRTKSHQLQDGDQITIGSSDVIFRSDERAALEGDLRVTTLLRSCSLLFLFRALASAPPDSTAAFVEDHIVQLIGDILPLETGVVIVADSNAALRERAAERGIDLRSFERVLTNEGAVVDFEAGIAAVPIYAHDRLAGMIHVRVPGAEISRATEVLGAITVLAAAAIENAREVETLRDRNALLSEQLSGNETGLIGESAAIKRLQETIARVAPHEATVLILGESGTGKELVARALHRQSRRYDGPFVAMNCAALTETLLESELFGHEKGAFTGAIAQKKGKLELAKGGTVFLDEIGELAPAIQAKLLRVLQEREFERVGGTRTLRLDVRLIAATNRDLAAQVRKGEFREDLFHRLNVIAVRSTPLRERREDIMPLARHFLARAATRYARVIKEFSPDAGALLHSYAWPGNVRELENAIERAAVLGTDDTVFPEDLPEHLLENAPLREGSPSALQDSLISARRESILRAWEQAGGDYKQAAALLQLHPNSLLRLIRRLQMRELLRSK